MSRLAVSTSTLSLIVLLSACDASTLEAPDSGATTGPLQPGDDGGTTRPFDPRPGEGRWPRATRDAGAIGVDAGSPGEVDAGSPVAIDAGPIDVVEPDAGPVANAPFLADDFESYAEGTWADGSAHGIWRAPYSGYGAIGIERDDGSLVLSESPTGSTRLDETHASLVLSDQLVNGDFTMDVRMRTVEQLRTPVPNAWEVAWLVWHYTDEGHFYYFVPKPNGWELGKVDNSRIDPSGPACLWPEYANCRYPGAQRFLADNSSPSFPVGPWYDVRVTQQGNQMTIWVNGAQVVSFTDTETPYTSGRIGLYNEDAHVHFDDVEVTTP